MNSKFINVLMFAAGAAVGSAVTWKILKDKYERIVQEEIESIKEVFSGMAEETSEDDESDEGNHQINWDELEDLDEELEEYANLTNLYSSEKGGAEKVEVAQPYVISPYDFGEIDEFHTISLTYYADGVLEDDEQNIVTDVDELIGEKSLTTFGEYEDDSVFVRNERLQTDFEILKDPRTYAEANSPNQVG